MNQLDSSLQEINNKITDITNTVNVINSILQAQQDNTIVITEEQYNMLPDSVKGALAQLVGLYQNNSDIMIRLKELDLSTRLIAISFDISFLFTLSSFIK